jgi:lysozyme
LTDYRTLAKPLTQRSEKLVLVGYLDQGKVPTWGWGHTGPEVRVGQSITPALADHDYDVDQAKHDHILLSHVDPAPFALMTEHEKAALLDFTFNTGGGPSRGDKDEWGIWKLARAGDLPGVRAQFDRFIYVHVDGKAVTSAGLKNRRNAEKVMWDTGDTDAAVAAANAGGNTVCSAACRVLPTPPVPEAPKSLAKTSLGLKLAGLLTGSGGLAAKVFTPETQAKAQNAADTAAAHAASFGHFGGLIANVCGAAVVVVAAGALLVHVTQQEAAKV